MNKNKVKDKNIFFFLYLRKTRKKKQVKTEAKKTKRMNETANRMKPKCSYIQFPLELKL